MPSRSDIHVSPEEVRRGGILQVECPCCSEPLSVVLPSSVEMLKVVGGNGKKHFPEASTREAELFDVLLSQFGRWMSLEQIGQALGPEFSATSIYRLVRRLRYRMRSSEWEIQNRWGSGYRLANRDDGTDHPRSAPIPHTGENP